MLKTLLLLWWCLFCRFWTVKTCVFLYNKLMILVLWYFIPVTLVYCMLLLLHVFLLPNLDFTPNHLQIQKKQSFMHVSLGEVWQIQGSREVVANLQNAFTKHWRFVKTYPIATVLELTRTCLFFTWKILGKLISFIKFFSRKVPFSACMWPTKVGSSSTNGLFLHAALGMSQSLRIRSK